MAVTDYSTNPGANTSIGGINIAEGCPAANLNNALRYLMADVRVFYNGVPAGGDYMPRSGGSFFGQINRSGGGGYLYNNDPVDQGGRVFKRAQGGAVPGGMVNGDILLTFA